MSTISVDIQAIIQDFFSSPANTLFFIAVMFSIACVMHRYYEKKNSKRGTKWGITRK